MSMSTNRVYLAREGKFPGWWVVGGCFAILFFGALLAAILSCSSATLLAPSVTFAENV